MNDLDSLDMKWNTPAARMTLINAPEQMEEYSLESFSKLRPIPDEITQWLQDFEKNRTSLILSGNIGRGKTGLGIGLLRELARRGAGDRFEWNLSTGPLLLKKIAAGEVEQEPSPIWFIRWQRLLAQERRQKLDENGWFDTLDENVTVLMIDDIGVETGTEFREGLLLQHLEWVEDKKGRTLILTVNINPTEWPRRLGVRIADRLIETRRFTLVKMDGENLRD